MTPTPTPGPTPGSFDVLICPVCRSDDADLARHGGTLRCSTGHSFDIARQGYAALLTGSRPPSADSTEMVQARTRFLGAGHYRPLTDAVAAVASTLVPCDNDADHAVVLDAGVGPGHYLSAVLDALPAALGLGLDTSAPALRSAARSHPRAGAASWDIWRPLPVRSGSVDLVLDVFAPRNAAEFSRVLRPDGALLVVTPAREHLHELREPLGLIAVDPDKDDRLEHALGDRFRPVEQHEVGIDLALEHVDVAALTAMTPTARHLSSDCLRRAVETLPKSVRVSARFRIGTYRRF